MKVYGSVIIKDDKFFNDAGIAIHATNALSRWVVPNKSNYYKENCIKLIIKAFHLCKPQLPRVFWGALSDKVNVKYILVFNNVIGSLLIPTLYIARTDKVRSDPFLYQVDKSDKYWST